MNIKTLAVATLLCTLSLGAANITPLSNLNHDQRDYSKNESGLVTASTAAKWINDWTTNRPANVDGRLFIMQVGMLRGDKPAIKHDDINVFSFDRTAGCTTTGDTRNDGITDYPLPIFSGGDSGLDGAFWAYDINPNEDMLLVVVASDEPKNMAMAARFLWTMNYWGMKKDHIALMNGTAMYMFDPELNPEIKKAGVTSRESMFAAYGSEYMLAPGGKLDFGDATVGRDPAERLNFKSIKTLPTQANFSLFASMEDMRNVVDADNANDIIIDGRGASEYATTVKDDGTLSKRSKSESKECGSDHLQQCFSAFEGRIKGAVNLEYRGVINYDDQVKDINGDGVITVLDSSMTFKSRDELTQAFSALGVTSDSEVYTYCRTGVRASLLTFASFEILGNKTHMYDGSWIQWSKLGVNKDTYGKKMIPVGSPWRNDVSRYSENIIKNVPADVGPAAAVLNAFAPEGSGNAIFLEDQAYRGDF